jgi:hypothetical protein
MKIKHQNDGSGLATTRIKGQIVSLIGTLGVLALAVCG